MKIHLLTGFLGSGKTTAIRNAISLLIRNGKRVGVVVNDQGVRLVDGDYFEALNIPNRLVANGCFCCNFNELDTGIQSLVESDHPDVIFAESVGSCTDIVATVVKPLLQFRPGAGITVSTYADVRLLRMIIERNTNAFDHTVTYIYQKQLEEAGIIVLNKIDLVSRDELFELKELVEKKYPRRILLCQNSQDENSVLTWLDVLNKYPSAGSLNSLNVDYDIYAEGEAKLAWYDQDLEIMNGNNNAMIDAQLFINTIYEKIKAQGYRIGHLKFFVNDKIKVSFTSNSQPLIELNAGPASSIHVLVNIRVQTDPGTISRLVQEAISEAELSSGCKMTSADVSAFQPGYPRPTYRM